MKFEIKNRYTGSIIFSMETESWKLCIEAAVSAKVSLAYSDLSKKDLRGLTIDGGIFTGSKFTGSKFTGSKFTGSKFNYSEFTGSKFTNSKFTGSKFTGSKFNYSEFTNSEFTNSKFTDSEFTNSEFTGSEFTGSKFTGSKFNYSEFTGSEFTNSEFNYSDVPVVKDLDKKMVECVKADGALKMDNWHTCETTHCRAGWAIHLAGKAGYDLEAKVGPSNAGFLIYKKSCPGKPIPDFFDTNEGAMADILKRAADVGK